MGSENKPEGTPLISEKQIAAVQKQYGKGTEITPELLDKLKAGDKEAFEKIYLLFIKPLFDFINTLLRNDEETMNIVQDTFLYIWEKRNSLNFTHGIKGILYTYSKSRAIDFLRKRRRGEKYSVSPHHGVSLEYAHDEVVIGDELSVAVEMVIDGMPSQRRKVFEMQRIDGKSNREIAKELGLSDATVSVHLKEARKELDKIFRLIIFFLVI